MRIHSKQLVDTSRIQSYANFTPCSWMIGISWEHDREMTAAWFALGPLELSLYVWWRV